MPDNNYYPDGAPEQQPAWSQDGNYGAPQGPSGYSAPQQMWGAPVDYSTPQNQQDYNAPQQPYYNAPQQPYYNPNQQPYYGATQQPYGQMPYPAPGAGRSSKLPLIFTIVFLAVSSLSFLFSLFRYSGSGLSVLIDLTNISAGVLMLIGLIRGMRGNLLFAIGVFCAAFGMTVLPLFTSRGINILLKLLMIGAIVLPGLFYVLRGRLFGNPLKRIMAIVLMGLWFLSIMISIIRLSDYFAYDVLYLFILLLEMASGISLGLVLLFHTPDYRSQV